MVKAYGRPLLVSNETPDLCPWFSRWEIVSQCQGQHYSLPGGSIGRRYVDILTDEVSHLASGNYPSERLIVFSSLILQHDRTVKKGCDIRRVLERRLGLWQEEKFDVLLQETVRCDKALKNRRKVNDDDHVVKVFSRLMLQGRIRAALRWITERSNSGVMDPNDVIELKSGDGSFVKKTVSEVLASKHPEPCPPHSLSLLTDDLPLFENVEVTGALIHKVVFGVQGGAGPGGCDANHWRDALLRYGSHSSRLRDAVAYLSRTIANNFVPWSSIKALLSNGLIALNKNPGVRPIGIGETLRRIVGKAVCWMTRGDAEVSCGVDQLCAGVKIGIEAAFHAVNDLFDSDSGEDWGLLTIDASNAFNSINRIALLWN
uniref:Reverse transcriptase domain-containing protein n=1 Tax=Amphimedon queenslandica TaxID=400682 RepID=A0A1X7TG66_AMPQE